MTVNQTASSLTPATGVAPVVIAQASPGMASGAATAATSTGAAPAPVTGLGTLSNATPGTAIVRDGVRIPVDGTQSLMAGDRVMVPDGGQAAVSFPGNGANKAPLSGTFTGGTDAVIATTKLPGGLEQVDVDMNSGDLVVAANDADADAAALAVKKKVAAGGGIWSLDAQRNRRF